MSLSPGTRLGPYEILASIGAGGMGEVFRARDTRLDREVALKVLPTAVATDPDRLQRFEQEARAAAALNHPNILVVHDVGTEGGVPHVVSELLDGHTLRHLLDGGALSARKVTDYAAQIASGLAAAHDRGIVHRDLKPENVFVTKDGRAKILDFGAGQARRALAGRVAGDGAADRSWHGPRDRRLHGTRAAARRGRRRPIGHLQSWSDALRDVRRQAGVHRPLRRRDDERDPEGGSTGARAGERRLARGRTRHSSVPREEPARAVSVGARRHVRARRAVERHQRRA